MANADAVGMVSKQVTAIMSQCNDTENRMRRSNLVFFGLDDDPKENWAASEPHVIKFCAEKLGVTLSCDGFERVHRLGRFAAGKTRPLIAKLTFFKDKERILSCGPRLKGTAFSVREDFSLATRQTRQKLLAFSKTLHKPFKLSVDKLRIGSATHVYDGIAGSVVELKR